MGSLVIGIDLSLNSAGFCFKMGDRVRYLSIANIHKFTSAKTPDIDNILSRNPVLGDLAKSVDDVDLVFSRRKPTSKVKEKDASARRVQQVEKRRKDLTDAIYLSEYFLSEVVRVIKGYYHDHSSIEVIMEDLSLGSVTNNIIQICEITMLVKDRILHSILSGDTSKLYLLDAPSLKMYAGKGNFTKDLMMDAYLDKFDDSLVSYIKSIEPTIGWYDIRKKKGKECREVKSPLDDLVDARWLIDYHEAHNQ